MKVYVVRYPKFAGKWIYQGYNAAWDKLGYDVQNCRDIIRQRRQEDPEEWAGLPDFEKLSYYFYFPNSKEMQEDYILQLTADTISNENQLESLSKSHKTFLFVQPNKFPSPWGTHPNFCTQYNPEIVKAINGMDNVHLWTFVDVGEDALDPESFSQWNGQKVNTVPLAFDSINYKPTVQDKFKQFDISFVGGWADNGFNEKRNIILKTFNAFKDSDLRCGFFINKNLTHQQECDLIANSKITLNIHDAYQRTLGLDANERTFKSLGLNGVMVSDSVKQLNNLFPNLKTSLEPHEMVEIAKEYLSMSPEELNSVKEENKQDILDNHCYTNRVEKLLSL